MGLAVQQQEVNLGILVLHKIDGFFKQVAGTYDDLCALFDSGLDALDAGVCRVLRGTVVSIGKRVCFGELYDAFPGALIEGLVVDVSDVGDQRDLIDVLSKGRCAHQQHGNDKQQDQNLLHGDPPS